MDKLASEYKVLIVDDVPTNVMLVQAILKKEGYTLLTCDSGTKALRIANEKHPNLILLDIMMPEMRGNSFVWKYLGYDLPDITCFCTRIW